MPVNTNVIPYNVAFTLLLIAIAVLSPAKLACLARFMVLLFVPFALGMSFYYLAFNRDTWTVSPDDGSISDTERYRRATVRSSAFYMVSNIVLFAGAKLLGISYSNVTYNYVSLFVTSMMVYVYDRCVSTDDGLALLKQNPGRAVLDAYLSFCSPSFMRYLFVMVCEIALIILIAYYIGPLIPAECRLISTLFRKSLVPVFVFAIVAGPLRFAWAYPTVSEAGRVPYLTAYMITFTILALVTYASGHVTPMSAAGVLILMAIVAMILQTGGFSNASRQPQIDDDATAMPMWAMAILSTIIVLATLVIAYRIFVGYLTPYLGIVSSEPVQARDKPHVHYHRKSTGLTARVIGTTKSKG